MSSPLRIFHCADLHLGLKFSRYPEEVAARLREARFQTLEKMVAQANREACDLFVVAGDLFDTLRVSQKDITRAAKALAAFDRVVALLPGNHDFHAGAGDDFWKSFPLPEHGRLLLLHEYRAYPLQDFGIDAVLYPCHCDKKWSERGNALAWLRTAERRPGLYQIGIAHGSFEGLSPDLAGEHFPMKSAELLSFGLDLWLLGHIHVPYPLKTAPGHRIYFPGTPEPDGMDCRHEGRAWRIDLFPDKIVQAQSVSTGGFRFLDEEAAVRVPADLDAVFARFPPRESANRILRLRLYGSLPREGYDRLEAFTKELRARVLHFEPDISALSLALNSSDIDRDFPRGSFSHRLLSALATEEIDREALQVAFDLLQECGR